MGYHTWHREYTHQYTQNSCKRTNEASENTLRRNITIPCTRQAHNRPPHRRWNRLERRIRKRSLGVVCQTTKQENKDEDKAAYDCELLTTSHQRTSQHFQTGGVSRQLEDAHDTDDADDAEDAAVGTGGGEGEVIREYGKEIDHVAGLQEEFELVWAGEETKEEFDCEPGNDHGACNEQSLR